MPHRLSLTICSVLNHWRQPSQIPIRHTPTGAPCICGTVDCSATKQGWRSLCNAFMQALTLDSSKVRRQPTHKSNIHLQKSASSRRISLVVCCARHNATQSQTHMLQRPRSLAAPSLTWLFIRQQAHSVFSSSFSHPHQ